MTRATIDQSIINSPYHEPMKHWRQDRKTCLFDRTDGRRPAGYVIASPDSQTFDDPGVFVEIPLVNQIRSRVLAWRTAGCPGVSGATRRLFEQQFPERRRAFCPIRSAC